MTKKTILVTGAAGFIGYHLALHLYRRGDSVIGFDNFNDYYSVNLKESRAKILEDLDITLIKGDLCDSKTLRSTFEKHPFTHIVNLAAQAGVRYSLVNPQAYIHSNIEGFVNILELCKLNPSIPLIYASSSSVYGQNEKIPFSESDRTDKPSSLYGATKKSNEVFADSYHHLYGIPVTGLRFFTVYGPWGRPDMAYYSFTKAILNGSPINVFNNGKMLRDFTYIDDIISGIAAAIDLGSSNEIFNLGNNQPEELGTFIEILEELLKIKAKKNYLPMQAGDVQRTYADISYAQKKLAFNPKVNLRKGLEQFVQWYKSFQT